MISIANAISSVLEAYISRYPVGKVYLSPNVKAWNMDTGKSIGAAPSLIQ